MIIIVVAMQLLRKRHIGNDIVTVIFQDPEAKPFCAKNIRSQFQHVFVVVKCIPASDTNPVQYKYVCLCVCPSCSLHINCVLSHPQGVGDTLLRCSILWSPNPKGRSV